MDLLVPKVGDHRRQQREERHDLLVQRMAETGINPAGSGGSGEPTLGIVPPMRGTGSASSAHMYLTGMDNSATSFPSRAPPACGILLRNGSFSPWRCNLRDPCAA